MTEPLMKTLMQVLMNIRKNSSFLIISIFLFLLSVSSGAEDSVKVMFYNVENFFDTENNPETRDDAFTPEGDMRWNSYKYRQKRNAIYKVIMASGGWNTPSFIGLCEIENRSVLEDLIFRTPLSKYRYGIVHQESPDSRGIDVALLYKKNKVTLITEEYIPYFYPSEPGVKSRDILYASFLIGKDTLHIFVNHWPSRWGGQIASEPKRIQAANLLRKKIDSLYLHFSCPNILIMGDFNDTPQDKSMEMILGAVPLPSKKEKVLLYNLTSHEKGSHKFHHHWSMLDQMIISGCLLREDEGLQVLPSSFHIADFDFLFTEDPRFGGKKLFRTYQGPKYLGGYSDHLPISLIFLSRD